MKKLILIFACCASSFLSYSQKSAVTEQGEEVILYDNGTWKYAEAKEEKKHGFSTNPKKFTKAASSTFLLKSTKFNIGVWINPQKWSFKKATENSEAEYELTYKAGDLYGMMITESIEIPVESLRDIALENAKNASPDVKIVKEEYRNVNGLKVLYIQMAGTIQGIKFVYNGYYYSNENGTVQFITYTSKNLVSKFEPEYEELLNGFVETKK